eukprot:gene23448-28765_t
MLTCAEVPEPAEDGISTIPFVDTIDASCSISRASEQEASVVAMRIVDYAKPAESGQMSLGHRFSARGHRHRRSICCVCDVSMAIARGMMQHSALVEYYAGASDRLRRVLICHQQIYLPSRRTVRVMVPRFARRSHQLARMYEDHRALPTPQRLEVLLGPTAEPTHWKRRHR